MEQTKQREGIFGRLARRMGFQAAARQTVNTVQPSGVLPELASALGAFGTVQMKNSESICSAVTRLANSMACMPLHVFKDYEVAREHPLEQLLAFSPNPNMTPFSFRYAMQACLGIYGYAYALIVPDGRGGIDGLDVLDPTRVQILRNSDTKEIWFQVTLDDGQLIYVHTSQMIALRWASTDGIHSLSPVEVLGATLKYDRAIKEISIRQLEGVNGAVALTYPTALSEDKKREIERQFLNVYKKSYGQIIVLEGGVTAQTINGSVVDPNVLSSDTITKSKIASVYNIPMRLVGANVNADYSTSEQVIKEYISLTLMPYVQAWEEELNRKLLMRDLWQQGYRIRFDMTALTRGDMATMTAKHSSGIRAGKLTPNEARAEDGLPPLPYGDELMSARDLIPLRIAVEHPEILLGGVITNEQTE